MAGHTTRLSWMGLLALGLASFSSVQALDLDASSDGKSIVVFLKLTHGSC